MKRRMTAYTKCWSLNESNSRCLNEYDYHSTSGVSHNRVSYDWSKKSGWYDPTGMDCWTWWMSKSWSIGLTWSWHVLVLPKRRMDYRIRYITPRKSRWALFKKWFTWCFLFDGIVL